MVVFVTSCEQPALASITSFVGMALTGIAAAIGLRLWNGTRERKAELYFEEKPEPPLITLGLIVNPRARI
jgi:hypothetical protein